MSNLNSNDLNSSNLNSKDITFNVKIQDDFFILLHFRKSQAQVQIIYNQYILKIY